MPWTIYRYILKDLLKLLATATTVLVLVISFAGTIRPLSEGLLSPAAVIKYLAFLAPTMLGFTVPFAGAFAATLVFTRMVSDNELTACRASGMSYLALLLPVVFLGLVLTLSLFYLSNWVVPSFYLRTAAMLEQDLTQVLVRQVRQGRPVTLGDFVLYADAADESQPPPHIPDSPIQPTKLIRLRGVAAGQADHTGRLRTDSTAQRADLLIYHLDNESWVSLSLMNVMYHDAAKGHLFFVEKWLVPGIRLPNPFRDNPRFLSWPQLRKLAQEPHRFDRVRKQELSLAQSVAQVTLLNEMNLALQRHDNTGVLVLQTGQPDSEYHLTAPLTQLDPDALILQSQTPTPVRLSYIQQGRVSRRVEAQQAVITIEPAQPEPWVVIELHDAQIFDIKLQGQIAQRAALPKIRSLYPKPVLAPLNNLPYDQLLALTDRPPLAHAQAVQQAGLDLHREIERLFRKAKAQLHERAALAVAAFLILIFSAVLSIKIHGSMPLVIYFWGFLPAIVVTILTHSGENLATDPDSNPAGGLLILWAGDALLALAIALTYWRLSRN